MNRCLRDGRGVPDECTRAFRVLLPTMMREIGAVPVAYAVAAQYPQPGGIPAQTLLDLGLRSEREGDYAIATRLLELAVAAPQTTPAIVESALFRLGVLCETATGNPQRALQAYDEVVRRFGVSPFADQARQRAADLRRRIGG